MSYTVTQLYLYAGVLLVGCSAAIHYFLYQRLRDTGRKYIAFNLVAVVLSDYLRASLLCDSDCNCRLRLILCRRGQVVAIAVEPD